MDLSGKRTVLIKLLSAEPRASDLVWCLFKVSCEHYKCDSLLRPFPKAYLNENGDKDIQVLRNAVLRVPSICECLQKLKNDSLESDLVSLLYHALIETRTYSLTNVPTHEFSLILERGRKQHHVIAQPSHIYKVDHFRKASNAKFEKLAEQYGTTKYAYHGSRVENYYSILNHGLQVSMNKVAAFGPGIYLSSELGVSLHFSPAAMSWSSSVFGHSLSIVAVAEVINHPDVKCQDDKITSRKYADDCNKMIQVPHKYFVVQNNDLVRITHLLLYTSEPESRPASSNSWTHLGATQILMIGYVILLLFLIIYNSPYFTKKIPPYLKFNFFYPR